MSLGYIFQSLSHTAKNQSAGCAQKGAKSEPQAVPIPSSTHPEQLLHSFSLPQRQFCRTAAQGRPGASGSFWEPACVREGHLQGAECTMDASALAGSLDQRGRRVSQVLSSSLMKGDTEM